ncbi:hypothetical protein Tco_1363274 [Tanacetum coccineum]
MSSSSTITYTSVYSDSEPWRFQWVSDDKTEATAEAPPSPDYVPGHEHLPSPDYVPGPEEPKQAPLSPEYPLPADASPTTLSPGYVANSDPKEDPEEDPADYPAGGGDNDDESSGVDADDEDEEEDDDEEEEEHLALVDSSVVPAVDLVPSAKDTEAFETDESAPTPPSPKPRKARIYIPLPPLPLPLPPTHISPTYAEAPLGYRAIEIRLRAASPSTHHPSEIPSPPLLLPYTTHRDDLPEADMLLQKRARFTAPASRFKVGESSAAVAARQPRFDVATMDATP